MWFNSLGFSLPVWLVGAAAVAGLAALYFLNEKRLSARTLVVPFLRFCAAMPKGQGRKRPRWPLLLLLQCGALLSLIAAAAGLHNARTGTGRGLVIIMDTSLSMQAETRGVSRFEQARREARREIDRAGSSDPLWLVAAGARARLLSSRRGPGEDVRRSLRDLTVTDGPADLEAALDLARNLLGAQTGRIHVFSDRARSLYETWDQKCQGDHPPVTLHRVGESAGNLAITGFSVYQSPLATGYQDVRAYLTLRNYFSQAVRAAYSVTLDGRSVASGVLDFAPQEQKTITLQGFDRPGLLRAVLPFEDALKADNEAFGLIVPIRPLRALVVSETAGLKDQLQSALTPGARTSEPFEWRFDFKTPAAVSALDKKTLDRAYDLIVFDGRRPEWRSLQPSAALWNGAPAAPAAESYYVVTDWNAQHELLEYLENFNLLRLRAGAPVPTGPGIEPVMEGRLDGGSAGLSNAVPVVSVEAQAGRRAVYFGFDLKSYRLQKYQHLKILVLNALRWLHPRARRPAQQRVGDDFNVSEVSPGAAFILQKPDGDTFRFAADTSVVAGAHIARQGLYRLRLSTGEEIPFVATRAAEWNESDLTVDADPLWPAPESPSAPRSDRRAADYTYSHRAWLLALVALLMEAGLFVVYGRRS